MKLSIIVIAKNEEEVIKDCLESVKWAEEIILLDGGSTDKTLAVAKRYSSRVVRQKEKTMNYGAWRNQAKEEAQGEWILYLDADERVTPLLKEEIQSSIVNLPRSPRGEAGRQAGRQSSIVAFAIPRRNFLLGKELHFGSWYPDYQVRLFKKEKLKQWIGGLHERPEVDGPIGKLKNPMVHLQPETIEPALEKSIKWSDIEARLLFDTGHPQVTWWRVLRMGATTLFERLAKKQGFRDGVEGFIESIYQAYHVMIVYTKIWELQNSK